MSDVVIKPSAMIQMINVFSKIERVAYNYLIMRARKSKDNGPWVVPMSEIEQRIGITRNNRPFLMDTLASLVTYPVKYDVLNKDGDTVWKSHTTLFAMLSFSLDGTMLRYEFASDILAYIREPKMYAKFRIEDQMRIKSSAAVALYEFFHDVIGGKRIEVQQNIKIDDIRMILGWNDKYLLFKEFNRQLNSAVNHVNNLGVINVDMKLNRRGRSPIDYTVTIKKQSTPDECLAAIKLMIGK